MRIELRNAQRQRLFSVKVDPASPPTVVRGRAEEAVDEQLIHLNWDRALDDERHLRRCPVCGCDELYVRNRFPRLTAFVMIAFAALIAVVLLGFGQLFLTLIVLGVIGLIDAGAYLFFSGKLLVCYRCRSEFHETPIARGMKPWQAEVDERYR